MNISYNWLRELTPTALGPNDLAERLTMVGLAVDAVHRQQGGDDHVLEIDLTSNRPDCLSHLGVAREVAVIDGGSDVRLPPGVVGQVSEDVSAAVEIFDPELCARYAARVVRGVRVGPSPAWLVARLEAVGQRSVNNIADITNYVMHELGQPLHAFDLATLAEQRIVVRRARSGETIKTLDGVERKLDAEMLVIADAVRPVAIAGVMGGEETEISTSTRDVLIESAYFQPESVRRTSKALGLRTESSSRFERGVDYAGTIRALDRCVSLILELSVDSIAENAIDVYPRGICAPQVDLRPSRVGQLIGTGEVPRVEIERILAALGFALDDSSDKAYALTYTVPTWRVDVEREEDLIEEVARHLGYDLIEARLPGSSVAGAYNPGEQRRRAARHALSGQGYDEAISFSFISQAHDGDFALLPTLNENPQAMVELVTLRNPIIEDATRMRPTLLPGLLEALRTNFHQGTRDISLYEIGRVFAAAEPKPREREALALAATGDFLMAGRAGAVRETNFYDVKGALEAAVEAMHLPALTFEAASVKHLRAGQTARVMSGEAVIGSIGRLSEMIAARYKFRQPVYVAEIDLNVLQESPEAAVRYQPLPKFPAISRDLSLIVARAVSVADLIAIIRSLNLPTLRDISFVDVYEGANLPEGKRSVTLRGEYRADDRTLRDEEVDEMQQRIINVLREKYEAQLRQ